MSLVGEGKGRVSDALELAHGVLEHGQVTGHTSRDGRLDETIPHQIYIANQHQYQALILQRISYNWCS